MLVARVIPRNAADELAATLPATSTVAGDLAQRTLVKAPAKSMSTPITPTSSIPTSSSDHIPAIPRSPAVWLGPQELAPMPIPALKRISRTASPCYPLARDSCPSPSKQAANFIAAMHYLIETVSLRE